MADISEVKALAFDVFGTTVDWCSGIARAAREMLAPKGYSLDWTRFVESYFAKRSEKKAITRLAAALPWAPSVSTTTLKHLSALAGLANLVWPQPADVRALLSAHGLPEIVVKS